MTTNRLVGLQYQSGRLLGSDNSGNIHLGRDNEYYHTTYIILPFM